MKYGRVAEWRRRWTATPQEVTSRMGSNPVPVFLVYSRIAQLAECLFRKQEVPGSRPGSGFCAFHLVMNFYVPVVQFGRTSRRQREGCGFNSRRALLLAYF